MAKKKITSAAVRNIDKAAIIDKIERDLPLTTEEVKVIAPETTTTPSSSESGTIGAIRMLLGNQPQNEPTPMATPAVSGAESGTIGAIKALLGIQPTPEPTPTPSGAESGTIGAIQTSLGKKPEAPVGDTGGFNPLQPMVPYEPPYSDNKTDKFVAIPYDKLPNETKKVLELNGKSVGMTGEQYYRSRGGVNASGYYGDSYIEGVTLSDAEYKAALDKAKAAGASGLGLGAAINAASAVKEYNASIASGLDPKEAEDKLKSDLSSNQNMLSSGGYSGPTPDPSGVVDVPADIKDIVIPPPGPTGPTGPAGGTPTGPTGGTPTGPVTPTQTYTAPDGKIFTDLNAYNAYLDQLGAADKTRQGQSAWDLLYSQFDQYGLGSLIQPLKELITEGISPSEMTLRLRNDPKYNKAYKERFAANDARIAKGLRPLSEAEYINLEDQYQNIMRNYGLPETYYKRGNLGKQEGFEKFLAGDVSPAELEDRISTAQNRIIYANPEVGIALKTFYPDITNGDLLAYALDPEKALAQIKRRITAAEVGASAVQMGLATNVTDAEYLARYGVTKEQAQQGYRNVAEVLPRASMLGEIYSKQGMGPYTQQTAEQEVFNVPGAAEAAAKRRKLSELETAQFSGRAGVGALARERAGGF